MKKNFKRIVAGVLAIALAITGFSVDWNQGSEVEAADAEFVTLDGYQNLTLSDYINTTNGEVMQNQVYNSESYKSFKLSDGSIASFDKKVLSMKMKFVTTGLNTRMYIAEKQNASSGLGIYVSDDGTELYLRDFNQNFPMTNNGAPKWKLTYTASDACVETFKDKEFLLQMSFNYGDFNNDGNASEVKIGMYFNGTLYKGSETLIENCNMGRFGTRIGLEFVQTTSLQLAAAVPPAQPDKIPTLSGFTHVTLKDFSNGTDGSLPDNTYTKTNAPARTWTGTANAMDKHLLSLKVNFLKGGKNTAFCIGGYGNQSDGFKVYINESGSELYLWDEVQNHTNGMVQTSNYKATYKASEAGIDSFLQNEFLLQMTFEKGDWDGDETVDDLQVGMYFNGKLYQNTVTTINDIVVSNFNRSFKFALQDDDSAIQLSSVTAEREPVYLEGFSHVSISDFGNNSGITSLTDKTYVQGDGTGCWLTSGAGTFNNTMLSMKVTFGEGKNLSDGSFHNATTGFHIAGKVNGGGFLVFVSEDGKTLCLQESVENTKDTVSGVYHNRISYSAETAGVTSFLNNEFLLQMSFEYTDAGTGYPGGNTDLTNLADTKLYDVKIGVYFNGKLYNNEKTEITKCRQDKLGSHLDLRLNASTSSLSLASVDAELHHNLSNGAYSYVDGAMALVNQNQRAGIYLDKPGDYNLAVGTAQTTKKVITYLEGDVNIDGAVDVRDIVASKKVLQTTPETKAAKLGMDMDRDDKLTTTDVGKIRTFLVTGANESISYIGEGVMPIAGFWGPSNQLVSNEMFQKIADMGVNLISYTALDYKSSPELVKKYLTLADKHKIGVFVTDSNVTGKADGTAVKKNEIAQALAEYRNYPAFCGMYLVDEPHTDYYGQKGSGVLVSQLGSLAKVLQKDFDLTCYANLFGMGSSKADGENAYERYVKEFCETVRPKVLMWDYYVYSGNSTVSQYFENMSIIRKYAEQYNIPFWSFIQAGNDWNTDKSSTEGYSYSPNQSEFEWNVNTSLAFGAKGIQYFPLIQPGSFYADCKDYRQNGLIGADGNTNQWYDYAKKMNTQIAAVDEVLMNSVNKGIILSGSASAVSAETSEYLISSGSFQALQSVSGDCLVGCFNYQGKTALYVVNYSTDAKTNVTLALNKTYTVKTVQNANSSSQQTNSITLNMAAGEGVLLVIQ